MRLFFLIFIMRKKNGGWLKTIQVSGREVSAPYELRLKASKQAHLFFFLSGFSFNVFGFGSFNLIRCYSHFFWMFLITSALHLKRCRISQSVLENGYSSSASIIQPIVTPYLSFSKLYF